MGKGTFKFIVACVVFALVNAALRHQRWSRDGGSAGALAQEAAELNRTLPIRVNDEIELTRANADKNVVTFAYRLLKVDAAVAAPDPITIDTAINDMYRAICNNASAKNKIFAKGISVRLWLMDRRERRIKSLLVNPTDCPGRTG